MSVLLKEFIDKVFILKLNRPEKKNALNSDLIEKLIDSIHEAEKRNDCRVIIITGCDDIFCAGADIESLKRMKGMSLLENQEDCNRISRLMTAIINSPLPIISAVNGPALAGGCGLATVCDFTIASTKATFGYPEVKIGFVAAIVLTFLTRAIGEKKAREILLSGQILSVEEALNLGLVSKVTDHNSLLNDAMVLAKSLISKSPESIRQTKDLLRILPGLSSNGSLKMAETINMLSRYSEDFEEGLDSFLKKRKPGWMNNE